MSGQNGRMQHMRRSALVLAGALASRSASAASPTKQQCVAANEQAQALRAQDSLKAARVALATCLATSCPGLVREDCADRIAEIDRVMPSLVFDVKDEAGHDVADVDVKVDGETAGALDGGSITLDPGTHRVTFESRSGGYATETVVVHEGEQARPVPVVLHASRVRGGQRVAGLVIGGAGVVSLLVGTVVGVVAKTNYDSAVSADCGGDPSRCTVHGAAQISSAHAQAAGATAAFIGGGALVAGGAALWLTARSSVTVAPTAGGALWSFGGVF